MIKRVSDAYKHNIVHIVLGPLLKLIEAFFDLLIPLIMKAVIDLNQYSNPELIPNSLSSTLAKIIRLFPDFTNNRSLSDALIGGFIILSMGIVGFLITMLAQYIAATTSLKVGSEVRNDLFIKILHLSKKDKDIIGGDRLLTALNSDTYQMQLGVQTFIRLVARAPFIVIGSLIFSFILDWRIGIAFTAIVPLLLLIIFIILFKAKRNYVEIQSKLDDISLKNNDTIDGNRVIRAFNKQEKENKAFEQLSNDYKHQSIKVNKINSLINPLTFAVTNIALVIIFFVLKDTLLNGDDNEKILLSSTLIAEMAYLSQIFFTTVQLTMVLLDLTRASVARKRIDDIFMYQETIKDGQLDIGENNNDEILTFKNVYFSYREDNTNYALKNINFSLRRNETLGIIGGTGSGKTTIINLLERFYDVSKGEIIYQNHNIKEYKLSSLRNEFGLVNQKPSLFKGDIKSNFVSANPEITEDEINQCLELSLAYDFVYEKEGLETKVEEGGSNFSGGQRQRLCIARTLAKNPKVLILDDSTSALDLLTDKNIRKNISSFKQMNKIIISQRISTISDADLIIVLDRGEIVGIGKHEQLLDTCPIYNEIYQTQTKRG